MEDEVVSGRKILREDGNVQMWQEYVDGPHRDTGQLLRYFVRRSGEPPKSFTAPHLAFEHFRKLTGAPASKVNHSPSPKARPSGKR